MLIPRHEPVTDRLRQVRRSLMRGFRWPTRTRRPFRADPDSRIFRHQAMCSRCDWSDDFDDGRRANDQAVNHGMKRHGDPMCCFVRVHAR
jgi:hypothetical protein